MHHNDTYSEDQNDVWIVCVTANIIDSRCLIAFDCSDVVRGQLYVPANSIREAIDAAELECKRDFLQLIEIEKCIKYVKSEWQGISSTKFHSIVNGIRLTKSKKCIHGTFYGEDIGIAWSHSVLEID